MALTRNQVIGVSVGVSVAVVVAVVVVVLVLTLGSGDSLDEHVQNANTTNWPLQNRNPVDPRVTQPVNSDTGLPDPFVRPYTWQAVRVNTSNEPTGNPPQYAAVPYGQPESMALATYQRKRDGASPTEAAGVCLSVRPPGVPSNEPLFNVYHGPTGRCYVGVTQKLMTDTGASTPQEYCSVRFGLLKSSGFLNPPANIPNAISDGSPSSLPFFKFPDVDEADPNEITEGDVETVLGLCGPGLLLPGGGGNPNPTVVFN